MKVIRQIGSLAFVIGLFTSIFAGIPWYVMVADDPIVPWWLKAAVFSLLGGILVVLATLALEQIPHKASIDEMPPSASDSEVMIINSDAVPGKVVDQILGLVQGHTVYAVWLGKDLSAIVRLILGGELTEYTEMMGRARATAIARMKDAAVEMGADAVINVRYMTTSVIGSAAELLVYGTAIKFK